MAGKRIVIPNYMPALDLNGNPQAGAKITFWANETTTLAPIYTSAALSVQHPNPISADASGVFPSIFADEDAEFSVAITDADDNPISGLRNRDNIRPSLAFLDGVEAPVSGVMADVLAESTLPAARAVMGTDLATNVNFSQAGTGAVTRSTQARLRDSVSVKDFGAVGDGVTDDAAAIRAALAAASGKTVRFPQGVYLLGSSLGIIDQETRLEGAGRRNTILLRNYNGGYLATLRDGSELAGLCFDGNGSFGDYTGGRTGGLIDIPVSHGNQSIHDCRLINADGGTPLHISCTGASDAQVGGSRLDVRNLETWRSDSTPGSGRFAIVHDDPGVPAAGHPISLHHIETGGYESVAFGACNDLYLSHSSVFECSWSANTRGLHVGASRFSGLTGYAINGTCDFSGVSFASAVTVAAGSFSQFPGCVFNGGYTDNSGASGVTSFLDGVTYTYTPVFKAGGVAFTLGSGSRAGSYHRVGNLVTFNARISIAADTTVPSGALTVTLPFAASSKPSTQSLAVGEFASSNGNLYLIIGKIATSGTEATLVANGGLATDSSPGPTGAGAGLQISGTYAV